MGVLLCIFLGYWIFVAPRLADFSTHACKGGICWPPFFVGTPFFCLLPMHAKVEIVPVEKNVLAARCICVATRWWSPTMHEKMERCCRCTCIATRWIIVEPAGCLCSCMRKVYVLPAPVHHRCDPLEFSLRPVGFSLRATPVGFSFFARPRFG